MKILIAFYSLSGNTKKIAEAVAKAVGGEMLEIKTKKALPDKGAKMYLAIGLQMIFKGSIDTLPSDKNPDDYDLIFFGTPVWAGDYAPATKSFLKKAKIKNKKIALFCVHGSDSPGKAFESLEKELASNEIVGKIDFKMDAITDAQLADNLQKTEQWAREIVGK